MSNRLPVPWLLYGLIYGKPVEVNSVGMVCSIAILFCMLLFVIMSIACFKWRMNRGLGFTMFLLYFVFVTVSLMFEYEILVCPVQELYKTSDVYINDDKYNNIYINDKNNKNKNNSYEINKIDKKILLKIKKKKVKNFTHFNYSTHRLIRRQLHL